MSSQLTLTWEQAKQIADEAVIAYFGEPLKDIQLNLLEAAWEGLSYTQIAQKNYLSVNYLRGDIGPKVWQKLSAAFGEDVKKSNFKIIIEEYAKKKGTVIEEATSFSSITVSLEDLPFPEGSVSPLSSFYQERGSDTFCHQVISQPGALLQVRSPQFMGKTSLLKRILHRANLQSYQTHYLDLWSVENYILEDWNHLSQWFCLTLAKKLNLENFFNSHWERSVLSSSDHCTLFFENYILPSLNQPFVLAIDDLDQLFNQELVAINFLRMARSWHEKAKSSVDWQKLRLAIAYSTANEAFLRMNPHFFNIGIPVTLEDFKKQEIYSLMNHYSLELSDNQVNSLMEMLGGHPYLINIAFYKIKSTSIDFERFLKLSPTLEGEYSHYLYQLALLIQKNPELIRSLKSLVDSDILLNLNSANIYQLESFGLIIKRGNQAMIKCQLYRLYFKHFPFVFNVNSS